MKNHFASGAYSETDPRLKKLLVDAVFSGSRPDHQKRANRSAQGEEVLREGMKTPSPLR